MALLMLLSFIPISALLAQNTDKTHTKSPDYSEMRNQSQDDLLQRYPGAEDANVTWEQGKDKSNTAFYKMDGKDYMTLYDEEGNWVETYSRRDWNDQVDEPIRKGFDSNHKGMEVESYWERVDGTDRSDRSNVLFYRGQNGTSQSTKISPDGKVQPTDAYSSPYSINY